MYDILKVKMRYETMRLLNLVKFKVIGMFNIKI